MIKSLAHKLSRALILLGTYFYLICSGIYFSLRALVYELGLASVLKWVLG